ncbi:MAG: 50S ribosomal protein L5 [Candidatus Aenigmarchaeota archaeon]|nr:50S ribosomal protein L5 [Candidatus Aenigmarchaeota archaeon]
MKRIRLEKLTLNMCTGEPGPELEKAKSLLQLVSGKKVVITQSRKRSTFGVAKGRQIGVMTTLRGAEAHGLLARLLQAKENKLSSSVFDSSGNFSFGIAEYIDVPGVTYDPDIGIMGFDVAVTLERPGYRVKRRKYKRQSVGKSHRITAEESIEWVKREFGIEVA